MVVTLATHLARHIHTVFGDIHKPPFEYSRLKHLKILFYKKNWNLQNMRQILTHTILQIAL